MLLNPLKQLSHPLFVLKRNCSSLAKGLPLLCERTEETMAYLLRSLRRGHLPPSTAKNEVPVPRQKPLVMRNIPPSLQLVPRPRHVTRHFIPWPCVVVCNNRQHTPPERAPGSSLIYWLRRVDTTPFGLFAQTWSPSPRRRRRGHLRRGRGEASDVQLPWPRADGFSTR